MEESKPLNKSEIENEKQKLQKEIKRLDIYKNCDNYKFYELDRFLCYFPNKATEIRNCFREKEGKYFLLQDKKGRLQEIIMKELCSLFEPHIHKGYKVLQLDNNFCNANLENVICLEQPNSGQCIGISIGKSSKTVSTNAIFGNEYGELQLKSEFNPNSGIQINHNYKDNNFHNEIKIFDFGMDYTLIIYPDTKTIKLTDFSEITTYTTFCDKKKEIFKDKEDIMHFFSTLSFVETEQVLQILNEHLEGKNDFQLDIETALKEIKNTIEENRNEEKKNEENSISNSLNNPNGNFNPINNSNNNLNNLSLSGNDLNKDLNQKNTFVKVNNINNDKGNKSNIIKNELIIKESNEINKNKNKNSNVQAQPEIEKENETSCNDCITCLKQCWSPNKIEK